ncbi:hypothetical protein A2U01_0035564, partial [Trifolium medium]|nr:hypothetical protein [Trifolium medium]
KQIRAFIWLPAALGAGQPALGTGKPTPGAATSQHTTNTAKHCALRSCGHAPRLGQFQNQFPAIDFKAKLYNLVTN